MLDDGAERLAQIAFGVDAAMLCKPRSSGNPAFVIEYICRENRIRSVSVGPAAAEAPPEISRDVLRRRLIGLMSVGVMPRANKWFASDSGRVRLERPGDGVAARGSAVVLEERHAR